MKGLYFDLVKDELWLVKETKWVKSLENIREAQFALGNGYWGTRGILEELPYDAKPGTYIAGVYDKIGSQVDELVNLPNPINFKFTIAGEKLDLVAMDILEHKRTLNMKKAVLIRRTLYRDTKKRRYDYQSLRFVSAANKNIGVMQIALTALDAGCVIDINTGIDTSVSNMGILSEGRKKHFRIRELGQDYNAGYLEIETLEKKHTIVYWSGFYYELNGKRLFAKDNIFRLKLKKGQTVKFTKIFYIKHFPYSQEHASYKKKTFREFNQAFRGKFSNLLDQHIHCWDKLWQRADIKVEGTENLQKNVRFNIYHMLICAHDDNGASSIGARTLSGEGYRGHIFWDAEIFLLPFYLFTFPEVARNMLLYRYKRLNKSRELAENDGFKGAKFAWESADTGDEETPSWAKDFDGTIIKIHTHEQEHHITADIAYAVHRYYIATGDEEFMQNYGYEMFLEIARFWGSRVEYNKKKKCYEIKGVIGPDEFHINVNNNAFTNVMAKWTLITACKLYSQLKKQPKVYARLKAKINLKDKEPSGWKAIAAKIKININDKKVIEQFDGFFKLKKILLTKTDENGILLIPKKLRAKDLSRTQLVKQADVVILLCLLDDVFNAKSKIANYDFYIQRTLHKSSLSASTHSLLASQVGDLNRAYNLFNVALHSDISNLYGNTHEGIHAASLGGTWQALIFGFAGIKISREKLVVNPRLPRTWARLMFSFAWQKDIINFELTNNLIKLRICSSKNKEIELIVFNKRMRLKTNKALTFKRHVIEARGEEFY